MYPYFLHKYIDPILKNPAMSKAEKKKEILELGYTGLTLNDYSKITEELEEPEYIILPSSFNDEP